jgi:hypothetical protein
MTLFAGKSQPDSDWSAFTGKFGPHVLIFDPGMDTAAMQAAIDGLSRQQAQAQFGSGRHALLFKPGEYELDVTVDYYVEAAGLGMKPGDVRIKGSVQSTTTTRNNNVTIMFWRAAGNFEVHPDSRENPVYWAVSQAAPYRRMHIHGDLQFDRSGWASGGLLANSIVEGEARLTSGQQWLTRNSELGSWKGGNWNRTFVGTTGTPPTPWPDEPNTVVATTPVIREKPFLVVEKEDTYSVFVPDLQHGTRGVSWKNGKEAGRRIGLEEFHVAYPGSDTAATLNAALAAGRHLLLTPGIYPLEDALQVTRPDTVILGLGIPTLVPQTGKAALRTADVRGVVLAGFMVDAGLVESPVLIEIGPDSSDADHADNPTSLHDVYCRVGGAIAGKAQACLVINSHDVIVDHTWLWRADHGAGAEWEVSTCANGLIVNGDDVTIYGLFNEHFQEYQTLWNGERGRTYFYQSEIPYDPPDQASYMAGETLGYASYKVADSVHEHAAWGLGIYSFFGVRGDRDPEVFLQSAIECPEGPGIRFTHVTTFAGGFGGIHHSLNDRGPPTRVDAKNLRFFEGLNPASTP